MTRAIHRSEALAAQLSAEATVAMCNAKFNGRGWVLKSPSDEVSALLIALKLGQFAKGELVITNIGMAVRHYISRKSRSET